MKTYCTLEMDISPLTIAVEDEKVTDIYFGTAPEGAEMGNTPVLRDAVRQVVEYFFSGRHEFDLPLNPAGTEFQKKVWDELQKIPYGETRTYGQVAAAIGKPGAARAIGSANNKNPICIVIPCHRVVGADGSLTGYAAGVDLKRFLLALEAGTLVD